MLTTGHVDRGTGAGDGSRTGPALVRDCFRGGKLAADAPIAQIRDLLSEGRIVVLKSAFSAEAMLAFRNALRRWSNENPPYPHGKSPNSTPDANYHRIDDGSYKSAIDHVFHQYAFNTLERLEDYVREPVKSVGGAMLQLQNAVGETDFAFSLQGMRLKVLHYPSGGGFLNQHVHPREPQRVGLILSLTRNGKDIRSGGTIFVSPFGVVDIAADHDIGDIALFRYDLPHGITAIDEDRTIDWDSDAGKWSVVLELRDTHGLSRDLGTT